jgi:hypothetical protein
MLATSIRTVKLFLFLSPLRQALQCGPIWALRYILLRHNSRITIDGGNFAPFLPSVLYVGHVKAVAFVPQLADE